jgi:hypothetical protein
MSVDRSRLGEELRAVVAARQELTPSDDEHLIDGFLNKLNAEIERRVDERVNVRLKELPRRTDAPGFQAWVIPAAIGAAIPVVAIAAVFAHEVGVIAVLVFVAAMVGLYASSTNTNR